MAIRIISFDISMTSPGVAIVEINNKKPRIIAMSHVKTSSQQSHGLRAEIVEAWATMFLRDHTQKAIDIAVREDFNGRTSTQSYPVFAAWSSIERACAKFGIVDFAKWSEGSKRAALGPTASKVKLLVAGKGNADKSDVEDAVRRLTGYKGEFACDDESDAVAVALTWAIREGLIEA